jgi:nucleotide-binding universal stress UspA family protein
MNKSKLSFETTVTEAGSRKESSSRKQKEILVPIDFSEPSVRALRHARGLAQEEKAHLLLLNVVEEPGSFRTLNAVAQRRARYQERTGRLRDLARQELGSQSGARIEVREGNPVAEIARVASQRHVDLIVLGRHEHHGVWHWVKGHTASKLSEKAPCPVLLLGATNVN